MRMFVAVVPPPEATADLDEFLEPRRAAADFRWTTVDQLHVTLTFLAEVPDRALDDLGDGLARAAARRTAFPAAIGGGGAFPDVGRARVVWAGLELDAPGAAELAQLVTGVRTAAERAGVATDGARFRPHVTVARLRTPTEATSWVRLLDGYRGPSWTVGSVDLVASYLGQGPRRGPRYETVARVGLGPSAGTGDS